MIYGLIPVGGKGQRLGLPYSKEMLPQAGYDFYNPILEHMVSKMLAAKADKIVFIYGSEFKEDIRRHYSGPKYVHVKQGEPSFAGCIRDFYFHLSIQDDDKVLFGLPDSIFEGNPFLELVEKKGIACGLFKTLPTTKVDRLVGTVNCGHRWFAIKSVQKYGLEDWSWGVLKFDGADIRIMIKDNMFNRYTEIGYILNHYDKELVRGGSYIDLGTWENLNEYWRSFHG